jgi:hypothetical protein
MKKLLVAFIVTLIASATAAFALPKPGALMNLPAYCKTEADVKKFADIVLANDNDALRAFIADPANTCIVLASVGRDPVRGVLISVVRYKDGLIIGKLRVGNDIVYAFGRE